MRSSRSCPSFLLVAALLATACAPEKHDYGHNFYAFGTIVSVSFYSVSANRNQEAVAGLEVLFNAVDDNWYPWSPGELQDINGAIGAGDTIEVSTRLKSLIVAATDYENLSDGRFNAGLGRLTELWQLHDIATSTSALPDPDKLAMLISAAPGLNSLSWQQNQLTSNNREVMIDLGGIAKGAILDDSIALLSDVGIKNAIINIGGDLVVLGQVDGRDAHIGIRSPLHVAPVAGLDVQAGEAVFTSGTYERYREIASERYAHILDPATGHPVAHTVSVTVVDDDAQRADAAATALLVGGGAEFDHLVERLGLRFALLIDASGDIRLTPAMDERLKWIETADEH